MPNYKGHLIGGLTIYGLIIVLGSLAGASCLTLFEWLACTLAGSLFPDIDTKSKGQKYFYTLLFGLAIVLCCKKRWQTVAYMGIIALIPLLVSHRGLLHRLWFLTLLVVAVAYGLINLYPYATLRVLYDAGFFLAGIISHLYLDIGLRRMLRWS